MKQVMRIPSVREYRNMSYNDRIDVLLQLESIRLAFLQTEAVKPIRGNDVRDTATERRPA